MDPGWSPGLLVQHFFPYIWRGMGVESVSFFKKKLVCNFPEDRDLVFTVEVVSRLFHDSSTRRYLGPWEVVVVVNRSSLWPKQPTFKAFTLVLILLLNDRAQKYTNRIERRRPGSYNFELLSHYWTM